MKNILKKFRGTFLLVGICFVALVVANVATAAEIEENTFKDVPPKHWSYSSVQSMIKYGIIDGFVDGTYKPEQSLTRAQFAKLLTVTLDLELVQVKAPTFSDVKVGFWGLPFIETVKDYLPGYSFLSAKPFFEPNSDATRLDVAIAIVKGMGLPINQKDAAENVKKKFSDAHKIPEELLGYFAVAIEQDLISGYPDGTFRPDDGLTRAAAASLLDRLLKSPNVEQLENIELTIDAPTFTEKDMLKLTGTVGEDTTLFLNGEKIVHSNGSFTKQLDFQNGDGTYDYQFRAVKGNSRYNVLNHEIVVKIPGPTLTVNEVERNTQLKEVTISGTVSDINDTRPSVYVNNIVAIVKGDGSWERTVVLTEGSNNIQVTSNNRSDKETVVSRLISFTVPAPEVVLEQFSDQANVPELIIKGTVKDLNDKTPELYINGNFVNVTDGVFSVKLTLIEGNNNVTVIAHNDLGKQRQLDKKINFVIPAPFVTIDPAADVSTVEYITIKVFAFDLNDLAPKIYINDIYKANSNASQSVYLKEGDNTFTIKAVNKHNKTLIVTKKIVYLIPAPILIVDPIPATSNSKTITIHAVATDLENRYPSIFINGVDQYDDEVTKTFTLVEGNNTITIKARNNKGKEVVQVFNVVHTPASPILNIEEVPGTVQTASVMLNVTATDLNDANPKLYLNGSYISTNSFNRSVQLVEGENNIEIKATNSFGKETIIVKKVTYVIAAPILTVGDIPETSTTDLITITASATDITDSSPELYLNGQLIDYSSFSKSVTLVPGANTFTIRAINNDGKITEVVKTITYLPPVI